MNRDVAVRALDLIQSQYVVDFGGDMLLHVGEQRSHPTGDDVVVIVCDRKTVAKLVESLRLEHVGLSQQGLLSEGTPERAFYDIAEEALK